MRPLTASSPLRVLLVDDLPDLIQSMTILLRLWGHDVRTAQNGPEALDAAANYHPHVVLLDVTLPGMDGYQVAQRLRSNPHLCRTFLVSLTGHGGQEAIERSRQSGCDCHILKPVNLDDLQRLLAARNEAREKDDPDVPSREVPQAPDAGAEAEGRLRHHPYLVLRRIACEYHDGILTLLGHVPTYYLKQIAQAAVAGIQGVERIKNEIQVVNSISAHPS